MTEEKFKEAILIAMAPEIFNRQGDIKKYASEYSDTFDSRYARLMADMKKDVVAVLDMLIDIEDELK